MDIEVTVLMPVYNGEKYLKEAIDSVLSQTFADFEFLIVNDGSTDKTEEIILSYADPRIRLVNQPNGGVSAALNTGLKEARGKYIARFDADDLCYPSRLQQQYDFMANHPDYVLIGSDADYMSEEGDYLFIYRNIGHTAEEIAERISFYCPFIHSSVFFLKGPVMDCGGYNVNAHGFEDYFLWMQLIKKGKTCNFEEPLIKVRFNASSVTVDEKDREPIYTELKNKAITTGKISEEEGQLLLKSSKSLSKKQKESSYNRMLGKKYLWNNYNPRKARKHLWKSMLIEPLKPAAYMLFLLSFFPKSTIENIYNRRKKDW